jgi:2-oxoglutarate dehydrogenase E2 component (dihydrolipoamide succinyltransferase)
MAVNISVPSVGESITEGTIARWFKKDGELLRANEPAFELETDKATTEVPSPAGGVLHIIAAEGSIVAIGSVVGRLEPTPPGAVQPAKVPEAGTAPSPPAPKALSPVPTITSPRAQDAEPRKNAVTQAAPAPAAPIRQEVFNFGAPESAPKAAREGETRKRMTTLRQRIAERLVKAQQSAAILTTFNEADMSAILDMRARYKEMFKEQHGVGLGFMSFFVKAAIEGLRAFPVVNAWIDGNEIVYHGYFNIGVAVSTEKGLVVPVLRAADVLSFAQIEKAIAELAVKARDGKIAVDDLQGGTFTITNGGVFGSLLSTPILNTPQSAILGMHTIQKRAVVVDDQIVIRPMMYLALSYDHRLIDGREAVQFLVRVKECIEHPERLLLKA